MVRLVRSLSCRGGLLAEEKFDELVDDGLAVIGPLDQEDVVLPSVLQGVIAGVNRQKNECQVDKDGDSAPELLSRQ